MKRQRKVIGKTTLLLRKWPGETLTAVARPVYDDEQRSANAVEPASNLPTDPKAITKLRHGKIPSIVWSGIFVLLATAGLIFVTLWFLILPKKTEFLMWDQSISGSAFSKGGIGAQVHKVLFTSLPTLAMTLISLWWANVDNCFRRTQPYKGLATGDSGRNTVLLDYMHD